MKYIIYCSSDGTFYSNRDSDEWDSDSIYAHRYDSRSEAQNDLDDFHPEPAKHLTILEIRDIKARGVRGRSESDMERQRAPKDGVVCV